MIFYVYVNVGEKDEMKNSLTMLKFEYIIMKTILKKLCKTKKMNYLVIFLYIIIKF